jgi:hypothetical protein
MTIEKLKAELQGQKGLIKRIRTKKVPSTIEMARLAQQALETSGPGVDDVDSALDWLLCNEYERYLNFQAEYEKEFFSEASSLTEDGSYPEVGRLLRVYKRMAVSEADPTKALGPIMPLLGILFGSASQSSKTRSGSSLMSHIAYLLERHGFKERTHFEREVVLGQGCKLDFFFPGKKRFEEEPKDCVAVACQTTSNDRFRLTFAQLPAATLNRACTAIGNSNFATQLGPESLTATKLREAETQGIKFVVLEKGIDARLAAQNSVMSYNAWFNELRARKTLWRA